MERAEPGDVVMSLGGRRGCVQMMSTAGTLVKQQMAGMFGQYTERRNSEEDALVD